MKRAIVTSLLMLAPATVMAQEREPNVAKERGFFDTIAIAPKETAGTVLSATQEDPLAAAQRRRRRGSMVGYIDDATVGSKLRIRFDAAFENAVPDRAEFFYAKCGCYRENVPPGDPAHDPAAPGPGPGIPSHVDFQQLLVSGEYGVSERLSAFVQVPFRWIQPEFEGTAAGFSDATGLGDVRVGAKLGLITETDQILTLQLQAYLATGEALEGLGTDHNSLEPALLYYQQISDRLVLEAQGGVWLPLDGSAGVPTASDEEFAGNVLYAGIGPSYELYRSDRLQLAPVVELLAWRVLDGFQTVPSGGEEASGTNIVNLKIGARTSFGQGSIYVGYGTVLTSASWYDDIIRVEYRYTF